jgi:hypothetical protein
MNNKNSWTMNHKPSPMNYQILLCYNTMRNDFRNDV